MNDFTELEALDYNSSYIMPELILLTSLILRDRQTFICEGITETEYKNEMRRQRNIWLEPLIPNLLCGKRELFYSHFAPNKEELPDVCMQCLTSFGLTVSGRLRIVCPHCHEEPSAVRDYMNLQLEMGVFWVPSSLLDTLLSQLIYKYYSHNGDRSWMLLLPELAG